MKNQLTSILLILIGMIICASCASQTPANRYAREHRDREFVNWKTETKKAKKAQNKRVKEHTRVRHTW